MTDGASFRADVIVVGAGPAGSAAAAALARRGRDVVLVEAARFPRDKVCGDVLVPWVGPLLERVGTSLEALAPDARSVAGCEYETPAGRRFHGRFVDRRGRERTWRTLPRRVFDERLAAHARSCGAQLLEEHRVERAGWDPATGVNTLDVRSRAGEIRATAPIVIAADGATSVVARSRGLALPASRARTDLAVGIRGYLRTGGPRELVSILTRKSLLPGCVWIVPGPDGVHNVGAGTMSASPWSRGPLLREELERRLRERLGAVDVSAVAGWQIPVYTGARRTTADGLLLAGDAAGLVDPFTGHGIQIALFTGIAAAETADRALSAGRLPATSQTLSSYEDAWRGALRTELRLSRMLRAFHARAALVEPAAVLAARRRAWADRFLGIVGHAAPPTAMLTPGFWLSLLRSARA